MIGQIAWRLLGIAFFVLWLNTIFSWFGTTGFFTDNELFLMFIITNMKADVLKLELISKENDPEKWEY